MRQENCYADVIFKFLFYKKQGCDSDCALTIEDILYLDHLKYTLNVEAQEIMKDIDKVKEHLSNLNYNFPKSIKGFYLYLDRDIYPLID